MSGPLLKSLHSTIQLKHLKAGIRKYMSEQFQYWSLITSPPPTHLKASAGRLLSLCLPKVTSGSPYNHCIQCRPSVPLAFLTISVMSDELLMNL